MLLTRTVALPSTDLNYTIRTDTPSESDTLLKRAPGRVLLVVKYLNASSAIVTPGAEDRITLQLQLVGDGDFGNATTEAVEMVAGEIYEVTGLLPGTYFPRVVTADVPATATQVRVLCSAD